MNESGATKQTTQRRAARNSKAAAGATRADVTDVEAGGKRYVLRTPSGARGSASADAIVLDPHQVPQVAYYLEAKRGFPTDAALAEAIGVHRSQISRWKTGEAAESENAWLLRDIASAVARLADHYERSTTYAWLYGENPELEGRQPLELLREGRVAEVLMVIQAETSGAYL
jgi:transcriptional regulator with XRE-family HTH domain